MPRWLLPVASGLIIIVAVGIGVAVWSQGGGTTACDRALLTQALRDGMQDAEARSAATFEVDRPPSCTEQDLADVVPEITRSWHMMPGGTMMREAKHPGD